jgi:hypothetical protein
MSAFVFGKIPTRIHFSGFILGFMVPKVILAFFILRMLERAAIQRDGMGIRQ